MTSSPSSIPSASTHFPAVRVAIVFFLILSTVISPVGGAVGAQNQGVALDHTPDHITNESGNESGSDTGDGNNTENSSEDDFEINASDSIGSGSDGGSGANVGTDTRTGNTPTNAGSGTATNETGNESASIGTTEDGEASNETNATSETGGTGTGVVDTPSGAASPGLGAGERVNQSGENDRCSGFNVSPECASQSISEWFSMRMYNGMTHLYERGFISMLGTPHPENDGYLGIFGEPVGETYSDLFDEIYMGKIMVVLTHVMVIGLVIYTLYIMPLTGLSSIPAYLTAMAMAGVIVFGWDVATAIQATSDAGTRLLLPDVMADIPEPGTPAQEHVTESNWRENVQINSAPIAVFLGGYFIGWTGALILVGFHSIRHLILFFGPLYVGLILAAMFFGTPTIKRIGSFAWWQYIAANIANWPTAILISGGYNTDFTFGLPPGAGDLANLSMTVGVFMMGLGFPLLIHTFFGVGTIAAFFMKGSVAAAGVGAARKYLPGIGRGGGSQRRSIRGGGYSGANKYNNEDPGPMQQKRTIMAEKASRSTGTRRSRRHAVTDGGTPGVPTTNKASTSRGERDSLRARRDQSSWKNRTLTERRRERYRKVRGDRDTQ